MRVRFALSRLVRPRAVEVWASIAVAVAVMGPAYRPGSLLSLDLVFTSRVPVPPGAWGLGPELPRRVPLGIVLAWGSNLVGGPVMGKALLTGCIALAFGGAASLARRRGGGSVACVAAGLLYAINPFLLTRTGAGQWGLVAATAVLPWVVPALLEASEHPKAAFLGAVALGLTGFAGGVFALLAVLVGLIGARGRRAPAVAGLLFLSQLPWLVPGLIVATGAHNLSPAHAFATRARGVVGLFALAAGRGFWRMTSQVGAAQWVAAVSSGALLAMTAMAGPPKSVRRSGTAWERRLFALAIVGFALAAASALPVVDDVYAAASRSIVGAPLRDGQRALALFLVWLAPAAAVSAERLGRRLHTVQGPAMGAAAVALVAIALGAPALWGIGGRLTPRQIPASYHRVKVTVARASGPVLALPWHEYLDLSFAGGRRVLNPIPDYLGGDVIASADPELGRAHQESADRRLPTLDAIARTAADGREVSGPLARAGVRWVVLAHEVDWRRYAGLLSDAGLRPAVQSEQVDLYEVIHWRGPAVTAAGTAAEVRGRFAPLQHLDSAEPVLWYRPGQWGWMRGNKPVSLTADGNLRLPRGPGPVWYWPSLLVLLGDVVTVLAVLAATRSLFSHQRSVTVT